MVDSINRFLEHPNEQVIKHIEELFGTQNCFQVAQQSSDRIGALRDMYQRQLRRVARYVRYFEMRDYNNRPQYLLFFASNHALGHVKMKEAMWAVDSEGNYRFSDATDPHQQILFDVDFTAELWGILRRRYAGKEVKTEEIFDFVNNETAFLETHVKATLKGHLEESVPQEERIRVREFKADGTKWRKGSFPVGVFITFPQ
jgi:hypothetical protein